MPDPAAAYGEWPSGIAWIACPNQAAWFTIGTALGGSRLLFLFPSPSSSYLLPPYLYFFWDLPQTLLWGYWFAYLSIPHGMYTVGIAWSVEVISLITSVVSLTTIAVSLTT